MSTAMGGVEPGFIGRDLESREIDRMLDRVRQGESSVRVVRGEAGIGKTELLRYCVRQASGCLIVQIAGVESELEMPFAAVAQLCQPIIGGIDALPDTQRQALRA